MPEIPLHALDTLPGKHSALVNLGTAPGQAVLKQLLVGADVVVAGYRPGALDRFGLAPEDLAARHPGVVVVTLSAWGHAGPWTGRRGFDSLVQAATGIAVAEGNRQRPGALPAQLLDHATGYLAAAGTLVALAAQRRDGGTRHVHLSLAGTAAWLLELPAKRRNRCPRSTPRRSCRTSPHPMDGSPSPRHQDGSTAGHCTGPIRLLRSALPPPSGRRGRIRAPSQATTTIKIVDDEL